MSTLTTPTGHSRVGFHHGKILMEIANRYPSLPLTIVEGVQNAIDAQAKHVFIGLDVKRRSMILLDDGLGVTHEQMDEAISMIAQTRKSKGSIGRFGIGVVSPINKCRKFEFSSRAVSSLRPHQWVFEQKHIESQHDSIVIPSNKLAKLPMIPPAFRTYAGGGGITWNTIVQLHGITDNRAVSTVDADELEGMIRAKLGLYLRQRGIECQLIIIDGNDITNRKIQPLVYTGEPFPVSTLIGTDAGNVVVELYKAPHRSGKRRGEVLVCEYDNPYGVSWHDFRFQALGLKWSNTSPLFEALESGYFEGVIRCENLRLAPERTKFSIDNALLDLYVVLSEWFETIGRKHFEAEKEQTRDARYKDLSFQVAQEMRSYLRTPEFSRLTNQWLETIKFGKIGDGHGEEGKKIVGHDDQPSMRTGQGGAGTVRKPSDVARQKNPAPGATRDGDIPTGVIGRGNHTRALVKDDSIGLWIEVADFEFSSRLWEFDVETGKLQFNSRNAIWNELDGGVRRRTAKHDRQIMNLQKWVILQVLILLRQPLDEFEERRQFVDEQVRPLMVMEYFTK